MAGIFPESPRVYRKERRVQGFPAFLQLWASTGGLGGDLLQITGGATQVVITLASMLVRLPPPAHCFPARPTPQAPALLSNQSCPLPQCPISHSSLLNSATFGDFRFWLNQFPMKASPLQER